MVRLITAVNERDEIFNKFEKCGTLAGITGQMQKISDQIFASMKISPTSPIVNVLSPDCVKHATVGAVNGIISQAQMVPTLLSVLKVGDTSSGDWVKFGARAYGGAKAVVESIPEIPALASAYWAKSKMSDAEKCEAFGTFLPDAILLVYTLGSSVGGSGSTVIQKIIEILKRAKSVTLKELGTECVLH